MDYTLSKLLHIIGLICIIMPLGGIIMHRANGGERKQQMRFTAALTHGVGMVLSLAGGIGMMISLGIRGPWPTWIILKVVIWLLLGVIMSPLLRFKPTLVQKHWWVVLALSFLAVIFCLYKPFV